MILYTLLTTHTGVDMTNVILTACIVYYIGYNIVAGFVSRDEYSYMSIAALALIDLYFSNQILHGTPKLKRIVSKSKKVPKRVNKRVRINPNPTAIHRYPNNTMIGDFQYGHRQTQTQPQPQPQYRQSLPQYGQPQYGQPQSQYGQPQPQIPMIDNRELAAELESNNSEESIESIAVSDTISYSSEEY